MADHNSTPPIVSVVVPVRNDPDHLRACLESLQASSFDAFEVIVVDDASTNETGEVARATNVRVVRLDAQSGPARARNLGAETAQGQYLFFIDADVLVRPDTIDQVVAAFRRDSTVDAIIGSYDRSPGQPNLVSQYKNLFHHFVHQNGREEASTFWTGCGAIKRSVFLEIGGFDTSYQRPCIEDIELGARLHEAGRRIRLEKSIQVKHMKHWSLWNLLKTDVWDRGVPWTELLLQRGGMPNDLNLSVSQRVSAAFTCCLLVMLLVSIYFLPWMAALPLVVLALILLLDWGSKSGPLPRIIPVLTVIAAIVAVVAITAYLEVWALAAWAIMLLIVLLNIRFYIFFGRERDPSFAALVFPLHVMYYLYSCLAFAIGVSRHFLKHWREGLSPLLFLCWI